MDKKKLLINIFFTFIYALFTLVTVFHHEIWADEAQVWQLAQNLSVFELFKHLVNEGHPSFFYFLVMPFAKLHLPIFSMQIICWSSMVIAVFTLLQFSPFNKFAKFGIIVSAGFLYFLPVIARSYSILPFLVFLAAILYSKSKERPVLYAVVIALIANTHVIMFGFCAILTALFIFENRKKYLNASLIMLLSLLAVIVQLAGTSSSNEFITYGQYNFFLSIFNVFLGFFINGYDAMFETTQKFLFAPVAIPAILLIVGIFIASFVSLFKTSKKAFIIGLLGVGFQFFIYIYGYNFHIYVTRIYSAFIILLFCFWITLKDSSLEEKTKKLINTCIGIFFVLTLFNGLKYTLLDLQFNYSSAKETAEFLENHIDKNALIIENYDPFFISMVPYLKQQKLWSASGNKNLEYIKWGKNLKDMKSDSGWLKYLKEQKTDKKRYLIISSFLNLNKPCESFPKDFKLIYKSKPSIAEGESYSVYQYTGK